MNKKFVKIVAVVLAAIMVLSVGYVLFAVIAGSFSASAASVPLLTVAAKSVPFVLAA